jgi:uncharacterized protein (DUF2147 family)
MIGSKYIALPAVLAAMLAGAGVAAAAGTPEGVWIDHTGRGAVEIKDCSGALCGHVVWVKDPKHLNTCRNQIIGNVKLVSSGVWDRGWIVDPDDNARYSVELKPIGNDRLRVTGYMGSKFFSETMIWKRAPADLKRCDGVETATTPPQPDRQASLPASPAAPKPKAAPQVAPDATTERPAARPSPERAPTVERPGRQDEPDRQTPHAPQVETAEKSPAAPQPGAGPQAAPAETAPQPEESPRVATGPKLKSFDFGDLVRVKQVRGNRNGKRMCRVELPYFTVEVPCDM